MPLAFLFILVLTLVWCLVSGEFHFGQVALGLFFSALFVLFTGAGRGRSVSLARMPRRAAYLALYLLLLAYDLVQSNVDMARRLLRPRPAIRPGIVRVPLGDVTDLTIALEEHAITMTPGQMVVDYSADERVIYVHLIDAADVETRQAPLWKRHRELLQKVFL